MVEPTHLQQKKDFVVPFHGRPTEHVTKWVKSINHYFDVVSTYGNKQILAYQYAPGFLKDNALEWWLKHNRHSHDWNSLTQQLIQQFPPPLDHIDKQLIYQQLYSRKQQNDESVTKYYYDVIHLYNQCDNSISDRDKVDKLIHGLKISLYQEAMRQHIGSQCQTPNELSIKLQQMEIIENIIAYRQCETQSSAMDNTNSRQPGYYRQRNYAAFNPQNNYYQQTYYTTSQQHDSYSMSNQSNDQRRRTNVVCYICQERGHISKFCPNQHLN
ncbi:unnamed protein product [Didymodactylos carnosus]|uniref:CCHC-type domain-containing protein n=1 Tax=Didymodactylos carnosus TaxID=1234261 RepID=A0A814U4E2_9BILA|nr:unnamed protein product [Didymodactylos carnosus]CAF1167032.1 unnamed protein product [Didymodactylos carnosus]CAF3590337.1 unnamed protein product [Didymodactylos carnosus]CAF3930602.1 unnamed protein product [Didymodactylos carnosus]